MENAMDKVYEGLYDITNCNMQAAGKKLSMSKKAFLFKQRNEEKIFDVSLCGECDNTDFLQIAYLALLGRMPDRGAITKWMKKTDLEPAEFRRQLIEKLSASGEYAERDVKIVNNIYNTALISSSKKVEHCGYMLLAGKLKIYQALKKVYKKLPERYRKLIKEILGR